MTKSLFGQGDEKISDLSIQGYLQKIEKLVDDKFVKKTKKPESERLLAERENATGITRVDVCLNLFVHFIYKSTARAKAFNNEALSLSQEIDYSQGYLRASINQAYILFVQGEFEKAMLQILETESDRQLQEFPKIKADCETLKSYIFTERGEYDTALLTATELLEKGEKSNNTYLMMRAHSAISHFYLRLEEYKKALEYCLKGLDYILQRKETRYVFPKIDEIARMTHKLKGSREALEIYDFYLEMEDKVDGPGDYIQSIVYMNIADIHMETSDFELAKQFLTEALIIIDRNNYRFRKPRAHMLMARLHEKMGDYAKTISQYQVALEAAENIKAYDVIRDVSLALAKHSRDAGDTERAGMYQKMHQKISDSLFSTEADQRIKILEARRKIAEISKEKDILEIRSQAQEERYRLILIALVLTLLSGVIAAFSYYKVKKKNEMLYLRTKELTVEKINQKKLVLFGEPGLKTNESNPKDTEDDYMEESLKNIILTKLENHEKALFFLDPKCSLGSLSDELQTNQKYLSQVINKEKKSNFNNYINGLRIDYLLDKLIEDEEFRNHKLSYIASSIGFNNQNTFYSAFKKRLGILPSYFIKQLNDDKN